MLTKYNTYNGWVKATERASTIDIGQEEPFADPRRLKLQLSKVGLIDEQAAVLPGFEGRRENKKDPRIK